MLRRAKVRNVSQLTLYGVQHIHINLKLIHCTSYSSNMYFVISFEWSTSDQAPEPDEEKSRGDSLVAVKDNNSIELHCIPAEQSGLDMECQAILTADLLQGLLRDRGKGNSYNTN